MPRPTKIDSANDDGLRQRCKSFLNTARMDAIMRVGDPVENLLAFVLSEVGRSADHRLDKAAPLCLYFPDEMTREEFIDLMREAKPNMISKKMP